MKTELCKSILGNLSVGYVMNKILYDKEGKPYDFEFVQVNDAFEELSGINKASIIGKKITDLTREYGPFDYNWPNFFEKVALNTENKEFQQHIEHLNRWLKVNISASDDGHLITSVTDISEEIRDIEEKRSLLMLTQDIMFELDEHYVFQNVITADDSLLFLPRETIIGRSIYNLFPEELAQSYKEVFQRVTMSRKKEKMKYQSFDEEKWYGATIIFDKTGSRKNRFIVSIQDITKQKQVEDELVRKTDELERFFQINPDLLCIVDFDGRFLKVNDAWEKLLGFSKEELQKRTIFEFIHPDDMEKTLHERSKLRQNQEIPYFINKYLSKDGSYRYIEWRSQPDGELIYGAARDITYRKEAADRIHYLSFNDQLTGLYNRRFYEEEQRRLDVASNLPISIILGDLNALKLANDTFGHLVGDELLIKAAKVMKNTCRTDEIICRLGGDEFAILLPNTNEENAKKLVDRIIKSAEEESVGLVDLSNSFGWSTKENVGESLNETLKRAEKLMYEKKASMRDKNRIKSVERLLKGLFKKSPIEVNHTKMVYKYCEQIGEKLGYHSFNLDTLKNAALFHDIGKITIEESILNKAEKLSEAEQNELRRHPETGYRILCYGSNTVELASYVLYHHERWDGLGYPHGLKGEEIPIQSRIIAVAEAYDAMTSERPYKQALSKKEAMEELKRHAGIQFDPHLVDVLIEIIKNSKI